MINQQSANTVRMAGGYAAPDCSSNACAGRVGYADVAAPKAFDELKARLAQVTDVNRVRRILGWDMQVMMPSAGAGARGEQQATLDRIAYDIFTSPETGRLLEELASYEDSLDPDSDDASLIRVSRKDFDKTVRIPADLRTEIVKAGTEGFMAWRLARPANDFELVPPAPRAPPGAAPPLRRAVPRGRRAVRRAARRLRARHEGSRRSASSSSA